MATKRVIRKVVHGYAYPKSGNAHNPTPQVRWYVIEIGPKGERVLDSASKLGSLKSDWPNVKREQS